MKNTPEWPGREKFLAAHGITLEQYEQAHREGKSWCSGCQDFLPDDRFSKLSGKFAYQRKIQTKCKECSQRHDRTRKEYKAKYYLANRAAIREKHRKYSRDHAEEIRAKVKNWRKSLTPQQYKQFRRKGALQARYKLTPEKYDALLSGQNGGCAICGAKEHRNDDLPLFVDHDHRCCPGRRSCGKCVRGLLCNRCNNFLGFFEELRDRASAYLEKFKP